MEMKKVVVIKTKNEADRHERDKDVDGSDKENWGDKDRDEEYNKKAKIGVFIFEIKNAKNLLVQKKMDRLTFKRYCLLK